MSLFAFRVSIDGAGAEKGEFPGIARFSKKRRSWAVGDMVFLAFSHLRLIYYDFYEVGRSHPNAFASSENCATGSRKLVQVKRVVEGFRYIRNAPNGFL